MSVRKSTTRAPVRELSGGAHVLRSLAFWIFLAVASFVVGLFILSPLINVASGSRDTTLPAASSNSNPGPSAPTQAAAPTEPRRRPRRGAEPDVQITPDQTPSRDVQPPERVDSPGQIQEDTTSPRVRTDTGTGSNMDPNGDHGATNGADDSAGRNRRPDQTGDVQKPDSPDGGDRAARDRSDRSDTATDTPAPRRRSRRPRGNTEDSTPARSAPDSGSGGDNGVQKSDGIDR